MIVEIILGCLAVTFGYTTFNLTRKVERLESWVEDYAARLTITKNVLDELDSEGKFEADDEIGTVFQGIKETITELETITEKDI
jgi:proline dehydrogenase